MKRRTILIVYGVIVLWTLLPMISVLTAGVIAQAAGCALDEGRVNPCTVAGMDVGEALYTMFVMGWMFLITVPTGLVTLVLFTVIVLILAWAKRRAVRSSPL